MKYFNCTLVPEVLFLLSANKVKKIARAKTSGTSVICVALLYLKCFGI